MSKSLGVPFLAPVTLRNKATSKYLYSKQLRYSHHNSSNQQLVATSEQKDGDSVWVFKHSSNGDEPLTGHIFPTEEVVRLEHVATQKNLHSHDRYSPVTSQKEVTAFGGKGVGDSSDDWVVEILRKGSTKGTLEISLKHQASNHYLRSDKNSLRDLSMSSSDEVHAYPKNEDEKTVWILERAGDSPLLPSRAELHVEDKARGLSLTIESSTTLSKLINAVNGWIDGEAKNWEWLTSTWPNNGNESERKALGQVIQQYEQAFKQMRQAASSISSNHDNKNFAGSLKEFENVIKQVYRQNGGILYSKEAKARYVIQLSQSSRLKAATAAAVLTGQNPSVISADGVAGVVAAKEFETGQHLGTASAIQDFLSGVVEDWTAKSEERLAQIDRKSAAAESRIQKLDGAAGDFDERANALIDEKDRAITALQNSLKEKVALDDSISYWQKRGQATFVRARLFGKFAGISIALSMASMVVLALCLFSEGKSSGNDQANVLSKAAPVMNTADGIVTPPDQGNVSPDPTQYRNTDPTRDYWRYLIIAVVLTFCIWICRVLVKLTLVNLHTSTDAEERVAMLQTYLSLVSDQSLERREDIKLILQTVFRPGSTGLVSEESGIQTPLELVMKTVQGSDPKPG